MQKRKVASVHVSFLVHATEDTDKNLKVISEALRVPSTNFARTNSEGYYGNPITLFEAHIISGEEAESLVEHIFSQLLEGDRIKLKRELSKYVDEHGALYLRIDRQLLFEGKWRLQDSDPVKIKIKPAKTSSTIRTQEYYETLLESRGMGSRREQ